MGEAMSRSTLVALSLVLPGMIFSQTVRAQGFLLIQPDVRSQGMGAAIAAVPDNPAGFMSNPALLANTNQAFASASFAKWLPDQFENMRVYSVDGGVSLQSLGTFGAGALLLDYGDIYFTDETGQPLGKFRPFDLSLYAGYSLKVHPNLAIGGAAKLVYSDMGKTLGAGRERGDPTAATIGFDLGVLVPALFPMLTITGDRLDFKDHPSGFVRFAERFSNNRQRGISAAIVVQNIGPDLEYNSRAREPLPRNLKVGIAYRVLDTDPLGWLITADANRLIGSNNLQHEPFFRNFTCNSGTEVNIFRLIDVRLGYIVWILEKTHAVNWTYGFAFGVDQLKFHFSNIHEIGVLNERSRNTKFFSLSMTI